jgi:hypothetical protein
MMKMMMMMMMMMVVVLVVVLSIQHGERKTHLPIMLPFNSLLAQKSGSRDSKSNRAVGN